MMDRRSARRCRAQLCCKGRREAEFVVIMSDDQGSHDLGCYGAQIKTPNRPVGSPAYGSQTGIPARRCAPSRGALQRDAILRAPVSALTGGLWAAAAHAPSRLKTPATHGLIGKWHSATRRHRPNARLRLLLWLPPGCVDFYSHIYYWGRTTEPHRQLPLAVSQSRETGRTVTI
jgi:hypothetical protein